MGYTSLKQNFLSCHPLSQTSIFIGRPEILAQLFGFNPCYLTHSILSPMIQSLTWQDNSLPLMIYQPQIMACHPRIRLYTINNFRILVTLTTPNIYCNHLLLQLYPLFLYVLSLDYHKL